MKLSKISAALFAALALASSAQAALITGTVELSAAASDISINFGTNTVTFIPPFPNPNAEVDTSTGALAALMPAGSAVFYKNFQYDPLAVANPIWTNGSTSFTLQSVTVLFEDPTFGLSLFGSGFISTTVPGFDPTPGTWSFSADSSTGGATFAWSSTASARPNRVPDGGTTIALLGASLLGLGAARRYFPALRK